jgi:predicted dehydrogenase
MTTQPHTPPAAQHSGQSRREFLTRTAAMAGAAALASAAAAKPARPFVAPKAAPRTPLKDGDPIRIGIIGPGGMGTGHCHAFCNFLLKGTENVEVVALADVCDLRWEDAKRAAESATKKKVDTYRDYRQMLERDDIHGVLIATPEHWHSRNAIDAIAAGKDVFCEKPMCLHLDESVELMRVVQANPECVFQVGTQKMQLKKYQEAKKLIEADAIGVPTFSQTSYCRNSMNGEWLYYAIDKRWDPSTNIDWDAWCGSGPKIPWNPEIYARWRRYRDWSTGIIGDLLVHEITPLMMALERVGWPKRVVARGSHLVDKKMENHDQVNIIVEFESGHMMTIAGSTCNEVGVETMIRGHKANLYLADRHCTLRPERLYANDVDPLRVECPDIGNDQDVHRLDWLRCIRTREKPLAGVELGTKVMAVVDMAARSIWEGRAYELDTTTFKARAV